MLLFMRPVSCLLLMLVLAFYNNSYRVVVRSKCGDILHTGLSSD